MCFLLDELLHTCHSRSLVLKSLACVPGNSHRAWTGWLGATASSNAFALFEVHSLSNLLWGFEIDEHTWTHALHLYGQQICRAVCFQKDECARAGWLTLISFVFGLSWTIILVFVKLDAAASFWSDIEVSRSAVLAAKLFQIINGPELVRLALNAYCNVTMACQWGCLIILVLRDGDRLSLLINGPCWVHIHHHRTLLHLWLTRSCCSVERISRVQVPHIQKIWQQFLVTFCVLGQVHCILIGAGLVKFDCLSLALDLITRFAIYDQLWQSEHISWTFS